MMRKKNVYSLFIIVFLFLACTPQTKESYLQDYKDFITDVSRNHKKYTTQDWEKVDKEFEKYSKDWKKKFSNEFTVLEKGILIGHEIEYNLYRVKQPLHDLLDNYVSDDYDIIKQKIKEYKSKDMQDDIDELMKQAERIGGEVQETMEEIFNELDIKKE